MEKKVKQVLRNIGEDERREIYLSYQMVESAMDYIYHAKISEKEFGKRMNLPNSALKNFLNGTYHYHIKHVAMLEALTNRLKQDKSKKAMEMLKIEGRTHVTLEEHILENQKAIKEMIDRYSILRHDILQIQKSIVSITKQLKDAKQAIGFYKKLTD